MDKNSEATKSAVFEMTKAVLTGKSPLVRFDITNAGFTKDEGEELIEILH